MGRHIFEHVVKGYSAIGGTVLMSMNQLYLLPQCDHIVQVGAGQMLVQGTYDSIKSSISNGDLTRSENASVDEIIEADAASTGAEAVVLEATCQEPEKNGVGSAAAQSDAKPPTKMEQVSEATFSFL
eukprot:SAG31_NODE_3790_length_3878_cov_1.766931_4_plen_127_part_00